MSFHLFGLECHECGQPAEFFDDGVTTPCGCGMSAAQVRRELLARLTARQQARAEATATRRQQREVAAVADAELSSLREVVAVLAPILEALRTVTDAEARTQVDDQVARE